MSDGNENGRLWAVEVVVPKAAGEPFADLFTNLTDVFTCFEAADIRNWRFEGILQAEPDRASLEDQLALAAAAAGIPCPELRIRRLPEKDWLAENRRQFPPVAAGRFFVYGSYFTGHAPAGCFSIALDAGLAFGSGTHETTRGCLLALDRLGRRGRRRRPLDLGCGSGILAIGMARLWRRPVAAADIDPIAVAVTAQNARRNRVTALVRPVVSNGVRATLLRRGYYDAIVANILARPLERLAPAIARRLEAGGVLVLSGLLTSDAAGITAAYRRQGLHLAGRLPLGSWMTLVFAKGYPREITRGFGRVGT